MEIEVNTATVSEIHTGARGGPREYVGIFSSLQELTTLAWVRLNTEKIHRIYFCYRRFGLFRVPRLCATIQVQLEDGVPRLTRQIEPFSQPKELNRGTAHAFHRKCDAGITLIELMVTVAMVAILASIAVPSYQTYVMRAKRSAAESALMDLAIKQQAYLIDAHAYATTLSDLHFTTPAGIQNDFLFGLAANNLASPPTFTITATPMGMMLRDTSCGMSASNPLTIDQAGTKGPAGSTCWQK